MWNFQIEDLSESLSLNHDLLVEDQLKAESDGMVDLESGFDDHSHGPFSVYRAGWWRDTIQARKTVRLFKLHGSLDYWLYDFPGEGRQYAIPDGDPLHSRNQNAKLVSPLEWKTAFLSGTVVKELHYDVGYWADMFAAFRSHLANHTHLICCGYGFGDAGINRRLFQWMNDRQDGRNRLIIPSPESPADYFSDKPYQLSEFWRQGRLTLVPKYLEKCTLGDLTPYFDPLV